MSRTEGARLLGDWLERSGTTGAAFAAAVGVSRVTAHHWVRGRIRPLGDRRKAVLRITGGAVPVDAWDRADTPVVEATGASTPSDGAPSGPEAAPHA